MFVSRVIRTGHVPLDYQPAPSPQQISLLTVAPCSSRLQQGPERTMSDFRNWRNLRLQPKTAFWRFAPVHRPDLEGQLRVDCAGSPRPTEMSAICALETLGGVSYRRLAVISDRTMDAFESRN